MIELAMNTIIADNRMGSHNAVIGTMVPPSEFETEKKGPEIPSKPTLDGNAPSNL